MKKLKYVLLLAVFLCAGLLLVKIAGSCEANAENKDMEEHAKALSEIGERFAEYFPDEYYEAQISKNNKNVVIVERVADVKDIPLDMLYAESQICELSKNILGISYDMKKVLGENDSVRYKEYKDGHETGASSYALFDGNGYMDYIVFRIGDNYEVNESKFIDKEFAYIEALKAIQVKYSDKNLDLRSDFENTVFEEKYIPKRGLCYCFSITGAMDGKWDDELSIFYFEPIISVYDVNDIEIASTFCY